MKKQNKTKKKKHLNIYSIHIYSVLPKPEMIKKFCHCQTQWRATWNNLSVWMWPVGCSLPPFPSSPPLPAIPSTSLPPLHSLPALPSTPRATPDCRQPRVREACETFQDPVLVFLSALAKSQVLLSGGLCVERIKIRRDSRNMEE